MHTLWVNCRSRRRPPFRGLIGHSPSRIKGSFRGRDMPWRVSGRPRTSVTAYDGDMSSPFLEGGSWSNSQENFQPVSQDNRYCSTLFGTREAMASFMDSISNSGDQDGTGHRRHHTLSGMLGIVRGQRQILVQLISTPMTNVSRMPGTTRGDMVSTAPHIGYNSGK